MDPCDRFVYVSDSQTNKISAYTICNGGDRSADLSKLPDGSLVPVAGSPFALSGARTVPGRWWSIRMGTTCMCWERFLTRIGIHDQPSVGQSGRRESGDGGHRRRDPFQWRFAGMTTGCSWRTSDPRSGGNTVSQYSITPATGALSVSARRSRRTIIRGEWR